MHMISGGAMHELMAAGEMPMSISIFRNHVLSGKPKGAPTEWIPLDLNPTNAGGVALPSGSQQSIRGAYVYRLSTQSRRAKDI